MAASSVNIPQTVVPVEDQINEFFDRVVDCANRRRSTLLAKVIAKRRKLTPQSEEEQKLMAIKAEIERTLDTAELGEFQNKILAEIENKLAEVRARLPETRLDFWANFEKLEQLMLSLGDVVDSELVAHYRQLRPTVEVGKDGQNPGQLSDPRAVAIDPNTNNIYVTEGDNSRVSVFSESGQFMYSFTQEPMKDPWGITINRDNVYITDHGVHGVFHFKICTGIRFIARLTGRGSADGQFDSPSQLAVSADGDIFIADYNNHRIQILDDSLNFERSIKHKSIRQPVDVKLTNTEVYILSNTGSPCVHTFSHDGEKIRSFLTLGRGMQLTKAYYFCLDAQENIIISDRGSSSVKVFSPNGTLIHTLKGFQADYYTPQGLALTNQLNLVVIAPNDKFKLRIFSL